MAAFCARHGDSMNEAALHHANVLAARDPAGWWAWDEVPRTWTLIAFMAEVAAAYPTGTVHGVWDTLDILPRGDRGAPSATDTAPGRARASAGSRWYGCRHADPIRRRRAARSRRRGAGRGTGRHGGRGDPAHSRGWRLQRAGHPQRLAGPPVHRRQRRGRRAGVGRRLRGALPRERSAAGVPPRRVLPARRRTRRPEQALHPPES